MSTAEILKEAQADFLKLELEKGAKSLKSREGYIKDVVRAIRILSRSKKYLAMDRGDEQVAYDILDLVREFEVRRGE